MGWGLAGGGECKRLSVWGFHSPSPPRRRGRGRKEERADPHQLLGPQDKAGMLCRRGDGERGTGFEVEVLDLTNPAFLLPRSTGGRRGPAAAWGRDRKWPQERARRPQAVNHQGKPDRFRHIPGEARGPTTAKLALSFIPHYPPAWSEQRPAQHPGRPARSSPPRPPRLALGHKRPLPALSATDARPGAPLGWLHAVLPSEILNTF